jgi:DNA-binding MarR family transcriptional regulator
MFGMSDDPRLQLLLVDLVTSSARFTRLAGSFGTDDCHPRPWTRALALLDDHGELRISEFARIDRCSQPSATALLQKLADRGLVVRRPDPCDARAVRVSITDAGREWLTVSRNQVAGALAPYFADLEPEQIERLTQGLAELRAIVRSSDRT